MLDIIDVPDWDLFMMEMEDEGSTIHLLYGNLCYEEDSGGESGDYKCPRIGSFCNGYDDCNGHRRVSNAPH